MVCGMKRINLTNVVISLMGCFIVICIHQLGRSLYLDCHLPKSHGVTLGFIPFYMYFFICPVIFFSGFVNRKLSFFVLMLVLFFMLYIWFSTHPLRVILMSISASAGYFFVVGLSFVFRCLA